MGKKPAFWNEIFNKMLIYKEKNHVVQTLNFEFGAFGGECSVIIFEQFMENFFFK